MGFCKLNSMPSPPYTVGDQPTVLKQVVEDVKCKLGSRASVKSLDFARSPMDDVANGTHAATDMEQSTAHNTHPGDASSTEQPSAEPPQRSLDEEKGANPPG